MEIQAESLNEVDVNKKAILHNHKDFQKTIKMTINKDVSYQRDKMKKRLEERRKTTREKKGMVRCFSNLSHDISTLMGQDLSSIHNEDSTLPSFVRSKPGGDNEQDSFADDLQEMGFKN